MLPRLEVLPGQNGWEAGQFPHPSPTSRQRLDIHPSPSLNSHNALVDVQEGSVWISQTIWFQKLGNCPSALLLPCPSTGTWSPHFPCCLALSLSSCFPASSSILQLPLPFPTGGHDHVLSSCSCCVNSTPWLCLGCYWSSAPSCSYKVGRESQLVVKMAKK